MHLLRPVILLLCLVGGGLLAKEMQTRVYYIPPDFIGPFYDGRTFDPFSYQPMPDPPEDASRQILEAVGVEFPPGANCRFDRFTELLTVHNTPENLDLVEKHVSTLIKLSPKTIRWRLEIMEIPASMPAEVSHQLGALKKLAAEPDSGVRRMVAMLVEGKGGTRIDQRSALEHSFLLPPERGKDDSITFGIDQRSVGARVELEGTIAPDDSVIEASIAIHAPVPPPVSRQVKVGDPLTGTMAEYPVEDVKEVEWVTGITLSPGTTKLVGVTASPWADGRQLAAFLTAEVLRYDHQGVFALFEPPPAEIKPPAGMTAVSIHLPSGAYAAAMPGREHDSLLTWLDSASLKSPCSLVRLEGDRLHVVNTHQNIERIAVVVHYLNKRLWKNLRVMLHTIEAPAAMLDDAASVDDDKLFARLESEAVAGKARFIDSRAFEMLPGDRVTQQSADEYRVLTEIGIDKNGGTWPEMDTRHAGALFEFEGTIGPDNQYIEVSLAHELHALPTESRRARFLVPKAEKESDAQLIDFHVARTVTGITLQNGHQRLFAAHSPPKGSQDDKVWLSFIRADIVAQHTPPRPRLPDPLPELPSPAGDPDALEVRFFRVPPDFLTFGGEAKKTAKEVLEDVGITFPKGTSATFIPATSQLVVKNTRTNLELVAAYVEETCRMPIRSVVVNLQIIEAPAMLLREFAFEAAKRSNHESMLAKLLEHPEVKKLDVSRIEGRGGQRLTVKAGDEVSYLAEFEPDDHGRPRFVHQKRLAGLRLEFEPAIDPDVQHIRFNVHGEWHTAPPTQLAEHLIDAQGRRFDLPLTIFHAHTFTSGFVMGDGTTHLVSMWKPVGVEKDVLQALFITTQIAPP
jgi:hypothetical protein